MSLLVENIIFKDTSGNSTISGATTVSITSPANINLSCGGNIEIPENINMNSSNITAVNLISSVTNNNLLINASGTNNVSLRTNAGNVRVILDDAGVVTLSTIGRCSAVVPSLNTEFANWNSFTNILSYNPDLLSSTGILTVSYNQRGGRYIQCGNMVYFTSFINCSLASNSVSAANVFITIPVTPPNGGFIQCLALGAYSGIKTTANVATLSVRMADGGPKNYYSLFKKETGGNVTLNPLLFTDIDNTFTINVCGLYYLF